MQGGPSLDPRLLSSFFSGPVFLAMGIPQLKRHLEPYAERAVIQPGDVVLDGPALAYHVLSLCSRATRKTSPLEQPSYQLLGQTALAWLDRIQACGLSVYSQLLRCL